MMRATLLRRAVLCGILGTAGYATSAQASLVVSLSQQGTGATTINVTPGQSITLNVTAVVTGGSNATADDGPQFMYGAVVDGQTGFATFVPGAGNTPGASFQPAAPFNSSADQQGAVGTYNGGDILGIGNGGDQTLDIFARDPNGVATGAADTASFLIGTVTFTVGQSASGTTTMSWLPYLSATGGPVKAAAFWQEDGVNKQPNATNTYAAGQGVTLVASSVPEPGSLALLGLSGLGLLARRSRA